MTRILIFLLAVGAAVGLGVASSKKDDPTIPGMREIRAPAMLTWVEQAAKGCGSVPTVRWDSGIWHCVLSDDFDGGAVDLTRWSVVTTADTAFSSGIPPAFACYVYDPRTVSVAGGYLNLSVLKVDQEFQCGGPAAQPTQYIGGSISTKDRLPQTYGRYEIRARFPTDSKPGLQSSMVLWPDDPQYGQASGEIEFAEFFTKWPSSVIPNVRYAHKGDDPSATNDKCAVEHPEQFHRYTLQWTPNQIDVWVDGRQCLATRWAMGTELKRPAPFDQPFYLSIFEALGASKVAFDVDDPPHLPATMQVDYVHIWGPAQDQDPVLTTTPSVFPQ